MHFHFSHSLFFLIILSISMSSGTSAIKVLSQSTNSKIFRSITPALDFSSHKGGHGKIGVLGGSVEYTGAPFYAAQSALKFGADLAFIFCSKFALIPIKSYSPELMVAEAYDDDDHQSISPKVRV